MQHLSRYILTLYWFGFVLVAAWEAQLGGYTHDSEAFFYPFVGLAKVAAMLGFFTWLLSKILNHSTNSKKCSGIVGAWLFSLILVVFFTVTDATCMPGLFYVPLKFAWYSVVGSTLYGLSLWCAFAWKQHHNLH